MSALYRYFAARCLDIARHQKEPAKKLALLDMAQAWLKLAEQAEKNHEAPTLVYETPEPRQRTTPPAGHALPIRNGGSGLL